MPKVSKGHGHRHHRSSKNPDHRARKDHSGAEARPKHRDVPPPRQSIEKALSGENDYVRRWLAQTEREPNQNEQLGTSDFISNPERTRRAHAEILSHVPAFESTNAHVFPKEKRKRHSSSDSSLLEVPVRPQSHQLNRDRRPALSKPPETLSTPPRKKQRAKSSDSGLTSCSDLPEPTKEIFERRARHKTREDRYEPKKKEPKKGKAGDQKPSRKKRDKRGDRQKAAKKAGEELIQNFSSKNISQDRLTIRPSHGLGLFNNGRASSPARRRGLPDLAFSEMEFLRHSKGQHANKSEKVISRSREKEKKKAAKVQDEISNFFKPRAPLRDLSSNLGGPPSSPAKEEHSLYAKQLESQKSTRNRSPSNPLGHDFELRGRYGAAALSPSQHKPSHKYSFSPEISRSANPADSASRVSGKATSYVSWSESQRSPARTQVHSTFDQRLLSKTPESVRRAIENTGIFRDTGITKNLSLYPLEDGRADHDHGAYSSRFDHQREKSATVIASSSEAGSEMPEAHTRDKTKTLQDLPRRDISNELTDSANLLLSTDRIGIVDQNGMSRQRIVVERFDPRLGWREDSKEIDRSRQIPITAITNNGRRKSVPARPLSREQIAKNARIKLPKRPSTTVPVTRNVGSEANMPHHAEKEGQQMNQEATRISQTRDDAVRAGISSMYANREQRPLLSRVSNFSLPTIHEDSHEYSPGHGEAFVTPRPPGSENIPDASQPRLSLASHIKESQLGSLTQQQQQQVQARDPTNLGMTQRDRDGSQQHIEMNGAWIGNSLGGTSIGPPKMLPSIGAKSLYLRQLQDQNSSNQFAHGSAQRVQVALWGRSVTVNDKDPVYQDQQDAGQLTLYQLAPCFRNEAAMNQQYDGRSEHLGVENFSQQDVWYPEADDQNFGDPSMLEGDHFYEKEKVYEEEHDYATPYKSSYQGLNHGNFIHRANNGHNGFWRPQGWY